MASQLFQTSFGKVGHAESKIVRHRQSKDASVPDDVAQHIDFISGIGDISPVHKMIVEHDGSQTGIFATDKTAKSTPAKGKPAKRTAGDPLLMTPAFLNAFYNVTDTPAIVEPQGIQLVAAIDDYFSADALALFQSIYGIPNNGVEFIGEPCEASDYCDQTESDLDVQFITAMGRNVRTQFYSITESNHPQEDLFMTLFDDIHHLVVPPTVISLSYGGGENIYGIAFRSTMMRTNTIFQQFGVEGTSILISSGDDGALGRGTISCPYDYSKYCMGDTCPHSQTSCPAIAVIQDNDYCILPYQLYTCGFLNEAVNDIRAYLLQNSISFERDTLGRYHMYSTKSCSQLPTMKYSDGFYIQGLVQPEPSPTEPAFVPSWPATSQYVTAVGATQFVNNDASREVACSTFTSAFITTGGGFSNIFPMPDYQKDFVSKYINSFLQLPGSYFNASNRAFPDISFAGHDFGIIYSTAPDGSCGTNNCTLQSVDGTSCSAPAVAGLISLMNDRLFKANYTSLGFLNYALYQAAREYPKAFNDITSGDNKCSEWYCCLFGYTASPGWDAVTGLGTINYGMLADYMFKWKSENRTSTTGTTGASTGSTGSTGTSSSGASTTTSTGSSSTTTGVTTTTTSSTGSPHTNSGYTITLPGWLWVLFLIAVIALIVVILFLAYQLYKRQDNGYTLTNM